MLPVLLITVFLAGCTLGVFAMLVIGIRIEERRMVADNVHGTRVEIAARQVMGVCVRKPSAHGSADKAGK